MATKVSRGGKLYAGRHSTVTPSGKDICGIAERCPQAIKISTGPINPRNGTSRGGRRVKLRIDELHKSISLSVIGDGAQQDVHVQVSNMEAASTWLREKILSNKFVLLE